MVVGTDRRAFQLGIRLKIRLEVPTLNFRNPDIGPPVRSAATSEVLH